MVCVHDLSQCVAFGECLLNFDGARVIGCYISFYGYFFQMLSFAVILLSQLGEAKKPTLLSVPVRMCVILWPSFLLFVAIVIALGLGATPFLNERDGASTRHCAMIVENQTLFLVICRLKQHFNSCGHPRNLWPKFL